MVLEAALDAAAAATASCSAFCCASCWGFSAAAGALTTLDCILIMALCVHSIAARVRISHVGVRPVPAGAAGLAAVTRCPCSASPRYRGSPWAIPVQGLHPDSNVHVMAFVLLFEAG